jgi:deoxyribodipyrimidine photo-lyase
MASSIIKTPLKAAANQLKRRANGTLDTFAKKIKKDDSPSPSPHDSTTTELERGIIDREFYPPEMTNARCLQYTTNQLARPIEVLDDALRSTTTQREGIVVKDAIVHWFKCDLRTTDNKALYLASEKAKANGVPLICMYIISPQDLKAHVRSPVRVDFTLRTLEVLKDDLRKLEIPLYVETVEKRKAIPHRILELCEKWGARHLFANIEYEVDELRREALMVKKGLEKGIAVEVVHDTCVVAPGELKSKTGNQYAVYSPWFRAWIAYLHSHPDLLELYEPPAKNPSSARSHFSEIFERGILEAPENKKLTEEEMTRFRSMWPPGEHEAHERLIDFLKQKVNKYKDMRNYPSGMGTSSLSVHLAAGTLSARSAVASARAVNSTKKLDGGDPGIINWISEVAWRDFYKHVLVHWPYIW